MFVVQDVFGPFWCQKEASGPHLGVLRPPSPEEGEVESPVASVASKSTSFGSQDPFAVGFGGEAGGNRYEWTLQLEDVLSWLGATRAN